MPEGTVVVEQPEPPPPKRDTRRSWRAARTLIVAFSTSVAALLGFSVGYSEAAIGDPEREIIEFEASLRDYIRTAERCGIQRLSTWGKEDPFEIPILPSSRSSGEDRRLDAAINALTWKNLLRATPRVTQAFAEFNYARSGNPAALKVHSAGSLASLNEDFDRINRVAAGWNGAKKAANYGGLTWIVSTTFVFLIGFIWWFFLDRLRDIAAAITGK